MQALVVKSLNISNGSHATVVDGMCSSYLDILLVRDPNFQLFYSSICPLKAPMSLKTVKAPIKSIVCIPRSRALEN